MLPRSFFERPAEAVAPDLIGRILTVGDAAGEIVETEAYSEGDPASHSFGGRRGEAVLIRALRPLSGLEAMSGRRGTDDPHRLCSGPANLAQALGLTMGDYGRPLDAPDFCLTAGSPAEEVSAGPRIGVSKATEARLRFWKTGSPWISTARRGTSRSPRSG